MQNWNSLRVKVSAGLIVLTLLILISSIMNYQALMTMSNNSISFSGTMLPAEQAVLNGCRDLYQALQAEQEALLLSDPSQLTKLKADFDENVQQAQDRMHKFLKLMAGYPDITTRFADFDRQFAAWHTPSSELFALVAAGETDKARAVHEATDTQFEFLRSQYNQAGELADAQAQALHNHSIEVSNSRQMLTLVIAICSLLIGVVLSYLNPKLIVNAVNAVRSKIEDISMGGGDLVSRLPVTTQDELGQLSQSVNGLLDQLQHLVKDVVSDVRVLEGNTVSMGKTVHHAEEISDRQHQHLSSLVTAITEISHAVQDISQHAQQTSAQSQEAQESADQGMMLLDQNMAMSQQLAGSVQHTGQIVTQLAAESERITSVLDVIRSIADQTNLLALNAAIEAARAGEQGRGFAVVADEVRTLAGRTQNSTADIQTMITALKQQVASAVEAMDTGFEQMQATVAMAEQMRTAFSSIQSLVTGVQDMNFQIASATEQQSLVMNEINRGVAELDELTRQAHQVSESVNSSAQEIDQLAHQLEGRVSQFRV